jgi:Tol biopolymer transport system component/tRNA A-37 threonylcarbamoyl transferase component Bud32
MVGQSLLHYTVIEKLGEGGMGVVYKARDTRLDRAVALKVLPQDRVSSEERRRRFVQEAKSASALNHPNIVTIYDIATDGDVSFIAMELVTGGTLAESIPRSGLPIARALKYAAQIADGLAAAHRAGIVHRDLKPGNIMLAQDGRVKILDFGLAKLTERDEARGEAETRAGLDGTEPGLIVGTVGYMSPEQAQGRPLDTRSDIFSFGVVLYEMVTGRKPFAGQSAAETMSAILRDVPKPVSEIAPGCPRELERVIERCLRKDPERRWQHMEDVRIALLELGEDSDSGKLEAVGPAAPGRRWPYIAAGASLVLAAAAVAIAMLMTQAPAEGPVPTDFTPVPLTSYQGDERDPTFSPDGTQVAFSWGPEGGVTNTYVKLIGPGDPIRLTTSPRQERMARWSPDGRWIAFGRRDNAQRQSDFIVVPALGGPERIIARTNTSYVSWTPDSKWVAIADGSPADLYLWPLQGGERRLLLNALDGRHSVRGGVISPDGRAIAVGYAIGARSPLHVAPLQDGFVVGGEPRPVTPEDWDVSSWSWTPDSRELVFVRTITGNNLGGTTAMYRVSIAGGTPRRLDFAGDSPWFLDVALRGNRLAYTRLMRDVNLYRAELGEDGSITTDGQPIASSSRRDLNPVYSPDGSRIAFSSDRSGSSEIWVATSTGGSPIQLTTADDGGGGWIGTDWPQWSHDGAQIGYTSKAAGVNTTDLFAVAASGGVPRRLTDHEANDAAGTWSHDGAWIYFLSDRGGSIGVWKMPSAGGQATPLLRGRPVSGFPLESADGAWVYFMSGTGIWRVPSSGGEPQPIVQERINLAGFLPTSRGVYYLSLAEDQLSASLRVVPLTGGGPRTLATLAHRIVQSLSLAPDLRSMLYARCDQCAADLMLVENFR